MGKIVSRKTATEYIDSIYNSFHFCLMSINDSGIENTIERDYFWTEAQKVDQGRLKKDYIAALNNLDAVGFKKYYKLVGEFAKNYRIGIWKEYNECEPIVIEELNDELSKHDKTEEKLDLINSFNVKELQSEEFLFSSKIQVLYDILDDWFVFDNKKQGINKLLESFTKDDKAAFISKIQSDKSLLASLIDKVNGSEKDEMLTLIGDMFISSGFTDNQKTILLNNKKNDSIKATLANGKVFIEIVNKLQGGGDWRHATVKQTASVAPFDLIIMDYKGSQIQIPALLLLSNPGKKDELYKKFDINNIPEDKAIERFKYSNATEQYSLLKSKVKTLNGSEKGAFARKVREHKSVLKLNELFTEYPRFMNEDLRDFLNCKEDGTENYIYEDIRNKQSEWKEFYSNKAACHQSNYLKFTLKNGIEIPLYNAKFVNKDGREDVFNADRKLILTYPDKGTYNYKNPDDNILAKNSLEHNKFDISPYYTYMKELAEKERKQAKEDRVFKDFDNIQIYNLIITDLCNKLSSDGFTYHYKSFLSKMLPNMGKFSREDQIDLILLVSKINEKINENKGKITNSEIWEIIDEYKKNINTLPTDNCNRS